MVQSMLKVLQSLIGDSVCDFVGSHSPKHVPEWEDFQGCDLHPLRGESGGGQRRDYVRGWPAVGAAIRM